jgi:hypothetical protein
MIRMKCIHHEAEIWGRRLLGFLGELKKKKQQLLNKVTTFRKRAGVLPFPFALKSRFFTVLTRMLI